MGISAVEAIATDWNNSFGPASDGAGSSVQAYVNALNNYQEVGVVVFALSNTDGLDDADVIAALPVLFSELTRHGLPPLMLKFWELLVQKFIKGCLLLVGKQRPIA